MAKGYISRQRMPSLATIMKAKGCSRNRAKTLQAICEARIDDVCFDTTGVHSLETMSFSDFKKEIAAL